MITTTIYLLISIGFYFIAIWWLYNHFDTIFNMQMKLDDDIIKRLVDMENRLLNLETTNPDGENTTKWGKGFPHSVYHMMDKLKR